MSTSNPQAAGVPEGALPNAVQPDSETEISVESLVTAAGQASEIVIGNQSVKRRSIDELIKLDNHLRGRASSGNGWGSIGVAKAVPPAANGETGEIDRIFNRL